MDLDDIKGRHEIAALYFPGAPLAKDMGELIAEVERRGHYETALRAAALEACACHEGKGVCFSCTACRLLVRADARITSGIPS